MSTLTAVLLIKRKGAAELCYGYADCSANKNKQSLQQGYSYCCPQDKRARSPIVIKICIQPTDNFDLVYTVHTNPPIK